MHSAQTQYASKKKGCIVFISLDGILQVIDLEVLPFRALTRRYSNSRAMSFCELLHKFSQEYCDETTVDFVWCCLENFFNAFE